MKMQLHNQILLVNVAILAGLAFKYFRGTPLRVLVLTGVLLLAMANVIFLVRLQKIKKLR